MADKETEGTEGTEGTEEQTSEGTTAEGQGTEPQTSDTTDWKSMSRKHEAEAKANRAAAKELAALKAQDQTDAERLADERDSANSRTWDAIRRAVTAEVKSVAAGLKFQDPADALRMLDLDDLTNDEGEVDDAAVLAALKDIAEKKPYLLTTSTTMVGKSGGEVIGGGTQKQSDDPQQRARDYYAAAATK